MPLKGTKVPSEYPRQCKSKTAPHTLNGPEDLYFPAKGSAKMWPSCRACRELSETRRLKGRYEGNLFKGSVKQWRDTTPTKDTHPWTLKSNAMVRKAKLRAQDEELKALRALNAPEALESLQDPLEAYRAIGGSLELELVSESILDRLDSRLARRYGDDVAVPIDRVYQMELEPDDSQY